MSEKTNLKVIFKNNLNFLIRKKDITQKDVADALKVTPTTVNEWVKGKKVPRMDKIDKLCLYFSVPRSALLDDVETRKNNFHSTLNEEQKDLLKSFEKLDDKGRKVLWEVMKSLCVSNSKPMNGSQYIG